VSHSPENDPRHLTSLAEEARTIADWMSDPGVRNTYLTIAEAYDEMAKQAERHGRSQVSH
jgi:hypothetical protein